MADCVWFTLNIFDLTYVVMTLISCNLCCVSFDFCERRLHPSENVMLYLILIFGNRSRESRQVIVYNIQAGNRNAKTN